MLDPSLPLTITEWEEWGDPREPRRVRAHEGVLALRQRVPPAVSRDARDHRAQRSARAVLGTREVGRQAARAIHLGEADRPADRDGRGPRRPVGAVRRVAGGKSTVVCASSATRWAVWLGPREPKETREAPHGRRARAGGGVVGSRRRAGGSRPLPSPSAVRRHDAQPRDLRAVRGAAQTRRRVPAVQLPGVEGSDGTYGEGRDEPLDVLAAIDAAAAAAADVPLVLVGWSFGADMALTVVDPRITGWVGIAPPLRFRAATDYDRVGADPRPKLLVLAANDEYRSPQEIEAEVAGWSHTRRDRSGREPLLRGPHRPGRRADSPQMGKGLPVKRARRVRRRL